MTSRVALRPGRPLSSQRAWLRRLRPSPWATACFALAVGRAETPLPSSTASEATPAPMITRVPLVLSVPPAVVDAFVATFAERRWSVGSLSRRAVLTQWEGLALRPEVRSALADPAVWEVAADGNFQLRPSVTLLGSLTGAERQSLYRWLAGVAENKIERWPLVYASPDALRERATEAGVEPALTERAIALSYTFDGGWALSDFSVLAAEFPAEEVRRWLSAIAGPTGFIPRLHLERARDLAETLAYWTLNDRNGRIRPVLLALLRTPSARGFEISPLLPGIAGLWANDFVADHVRYDVTPMSFQLAVSLGDPARPPPADRPVATWFAEAFAPVAGPRRFGDVIVLKPGPTTPLTFACTWIDEDIVFARDPVGLGLWRFMTLTELQHRNPHFAAGTWVTYRRRE